MVGLTDETKLTQRNSLLVWAQEDRQVMVELYVSPKGAYHSLSDFLKLMLHISDNLFK